MHDAEQLAEVAVNDGKPKWYERSLADWGIKSVLVAIGLAFLTWFQSTVDRKIDQTARTLVPVATYREDKDAWDKRYREDREAWDKRYSSDREADRELQAQVRAELHSRLTRQEQQLSTIEQDIKSLLRSRDTAAAAR